MCVCVCVCVCECVCIAKFGEVGIRAGPGISHLSPHLANGEKFLSAPSSISWLYGDYPPRSPSLTG